MCLAEPEEEGLQTKKRDQFVPCRVALDFLIELHLEMETTLLHFSR